ncbi:hypothetical protein D9611_003604 [Ephemerocybe angulata]|uniref:Signal recognition particle subunit SRP72 n=1 Tax=Ephemerocybe angulata TaxID=980116 RepID=A0A8H5B601_9AGAR|nr:hypothetical protein D9611_003604 [Tulosesus angulatus]
MPPRAVQKPNSAPVNLAKKGPNRKAAPKQPIPPAERLRRLFTSLCAQIEGGHFANALKTCDKILRIEPNDEDARKTKLFLLLQTEQYDNALTLIETHQAQAPHDFEKSYSLYRKHHETEAKAILEDIKAKDSDHRGVLHLEAQLNYREGAYQAAFDLYNQLLDTAEPNSEEQSDILTNLQASQQHLEFLSKGFLHALDQLPSNVSANLESNPPPVVATTAIAVAAPAETQRLTEPAAKKVRKSRVPAGVTPGVTPPPDPERWLKKSERSTFGQGKRRKGAGGATQGSSSLDTGSGPTISNTPSKSSGGKGRKKK